MRTSHDGSFELQTFGHSYDPAATFSPQSSIHKQWKCELYELLEHPSATTSSFLVHILSTSLIVISAVVTVCETIPTFHVVSSSVWFGIESALVALFTLEYVARALAWSFSWGAFWRWALSFFGIVDLLAIAPYYLEILFNVDTSVMFRFSILRTFRLLRVFRAFRTNNTITLTIEIMYLSVRRSSHALLALGFFLLMFLVIFSTILYFAERGSWDPILETFIDVDGEPSQFASIPAAGWFVLVTITTVGYGDLTPRSFVGRLLTVPLLVFGLLLIALPSFVLGREFSALWDAHHASTDGAGLGVGRDRHETDLNNPSSAALARQIMDLQGALDTQGQMLRRLLTATEMLSNPYLSPSISARAHPTSNLFSRQVLFDAQADTDDDASSNAEIDIGGEAGRLSPNSRRRAVLGKGKGRASSHQTTIATLEERS